MTEDHPHACGDKTTIVNAVISGCGSSPRVWGQERFQVAAVNKIRIIPTRVGTSDSWSVTVHAYEDHPHACGDKEQPQSDDGLGRGSSPRVWGQVSRDMMRDFDGRIIPTRVGTRLIRIKSSSATQDHPHACGDKS